MGWVPAVVEGSEFDRPKEFIIPRVPHDQSSNCGSSVKAGIVIAFYRQAQCVGIGLPWRWSGHVCLR